MGLEVLLAVSAISSIAGGISAQRESEKQAQQAQTEAKEQGEIRADEVRRQIARNTALFAKSGVSLEGSPLFSLEEDAATGVSDVKSILRGGAARASSLRGQGRAALLGGVAKGLGTASSIGSASGGKTSKGNASTKFAKINKGVSKSSGVSTRDLQGAF